MRLERTWWLVVASVLGVLILATVASAAFVGLPTGGGQINDDIALGVDPAQDAGFSDAAGGSLTAGALDVPWATFEQQAGSAQHIFVRAFKAGSWVTQGQSLNISPAVRAQVPAIDFAGPGRTVPWVAWFEPPEGTATPTRVFASRFCAAAGAGCGAANLWVPEGQGRGAGFGQTLNLNVAHTAENPSVAGGATAAGADPVPWVTWRERDGAATDEAAAFQIFVARGVKQDAPGTPCPLTTEPAGTPPPGLFCWQQVGIDRLNPAGGSLPLLGDPSLSIDPTRDGVDPDIAFTGPGDTVGWVVWYEEDNARVSGTLGLNTNQMVFAAKLVPDPLADGGFHWQAVGAGTAGQANVIDATNQTGQTNGFGPCAASKPAERKCALNKDPDRNALDVRVAAGTLTPGGATVPWATWTEDIGGGIHAIFVSRLVGGDHFELFNGGQPVSTITRDAGAPDITFSGNTPYVSWFEDFGGGVLRGFYGHFEGGAAAPVFKLDTPAAGIAVAPGGATPANLIDARTPLSSGCTANPFTSDGSACPAGAAGTPFFLFTTASPPAPQKLFGQAYGPTDVATGDASAVSTSGATLAGSVNPGGATVNARFEFGPTSAYGTSTTTVKVGPATTPTGFTGTASGLPRGTLVHYRGVVSSDFATFVGPDRTFTTASGAVVADTRKPTVTVKALFKRSGDILRARKVRQSVRLSEAATVRVVDYLLPAGAKAAAKKRPKPIVLGVKQVRFTKAGTRTVAATLRGSGRRALKARRRARIELKVTATDKAGNKTIVRVFKTIKR